MFCVLFVLVNCYFRLRDTQTALRLWSSTNAVKETIYYNKQTNISVLNIMIISKKKNVRKNYVHRNVK